MTLVNETIYGFIPYFLLQAGDRIEIRNVTKNISSIYTVDSVAIDGSGEITATDSISLLIDDGDTVLVRRIDENEEFPAYSHAMIGVPGSLEFNRKDMRALANMCSHSARPLVAIEES